MRLRLKLLRIILRNCKLLFFIPIIIAYCLLPGVSAFKYFYVLMVFPTIAFAVIMFHLSWLEYMRLALQFSIIINFLYFMIMLLKNVTIGCIPVVAYLLLCFYISGSADFASFSIIAPNLPAEFSNWNTLLVVFSSSLLGLLLGYLLDRFWYKYL